MVVHRELTAFTPHALIDWLRARGVHVDLIESHLPMPTVTAAAEAIGVDEAQILKTLLFVDRKGTLARVIAAGNDRIDRALLAEVASLDHPKLADSSLVLDATGWPAGGVAPVGSRTPLRTWIDEGVLNRDIVCGGGGTEHTLICLEPGEIVRLTDAKVVKLTRQGAG